MQNNLTDEERDQYIANEINQNRCPFGMLDNPNSGVLFCCSLGLPGCACADELEFNRYLIPYPEPNSEGGY
jgi:hypothetical protein